MQKIRRPFGKVLQRATFDRIWSYYRETMLPNPKLIFRKNATIQDPHVPLDVFRSPHDRRIAKRYPHYRFLQKKTSRATVRLNKATER